MEPNRRIEDLMRRYGYKENRVFRVLAVAVAILLAILLALRVLRALAVPAAIEAIVVVGGWLLISSLFPPIPRLSTTGPVVRNGVVAVVACGKKRGFEVISASEPRTGTWAVERRGACNVYYHHPPDWHQRLARHQRAEREQHAH